MTQIATTSGTSPPLRFLIWTGVAAPLVYVAVVVAGGASIAGYSHLNDPISSLTESGRGGFPWINIGFLLYNLLVAAFAVSGLRTHRREPLWQVIFWLLFLTAVSGLLMWPFAQDPIGTPTSLTGALHLALAAIESLSSIAIVAISIRTLWITGHRRLAVFAGGCLGFIIPFGIAAAAATAGHWQLMGLFERVTIGAFETWIGVIALAYAFGLLAPDTPSQ